MAEKLVLNSHICTKLHSSNPKLHLDEIEPLSPVPTSCMSKSCIHKSDMKVEKEVEKKGKSKKKIRKRKEESDSESSESDESDSTTESGESASESSESESSSSSDESRKGKKKKKYKSKKEVKKSKTKKEKSKPVKATLIKPAEIKLEPEVVAEGSKESQSDDSSSDEFSALQKQLEASGLLKGSKKAGNLLKEILKLASRKGSDDDTKSTRSKKSERTSKHKSDKRDKKGKDKDAMKAKYKRLDEIWDEDLYDYRLRETSDKIETDEYEKYIFTVRRKFDIENHYQNTVVDVKSAPLRECLKEVLGEVPGVSLVEKHPRLMPDLLFMYLEDLKEYRQILADARTKSSDKKIRKALKIKAQHLDLLIAYVDKDYDELKKTLYPMLECGTITFENLWVLFKPNTIVYKSTYGDDSQPRAFKIEYASKERDFAKGLYYDVEGKYFDYDGEKFGWAYINAEVNTFPGARKITSLPCYPLKYHQKYETIRTTLLERGKKFLMLAGMNYRYCKGLCYQKKDNKVLKVNIDGRVMVDPKTFRRINPNYMLSEVETKEVEDEDSACHCEKMDQPHQVVSGQDRFFVAVKDIDEKTVTDVVEVDRDVLADPVQKAEVNRTGYTENELLCASPLMPGFSFSEKMWIEIAVASLSPIPWNEGAFDALVIPEKHKSIVKALVSAHAQFASKSIDDVVSGKGKGLVAVLHGKPGLGKTLTCEAVSDLLKRPLYAVSAGDLGTSSTHLEFQLQTILDIAHTWGAVLLLDEADVFLEERSSRDISRNALVSVFLRLLEYNQGILFLTTNRVETFDEAFVSRIHLSLRYAELTIPARKAIWKTFIKKVAQTGGALSPDPSPSSSTGMPTPAMTTSTPNSGTTTPTPIIDQPANSSMPSLSASVTSLESVESDKTITLSNVETSVSAPPPAGTSNNPDSAPAIERITEANFTELARIDLNGRQIKNLVKTAQALALYEGVPMGMGHLRRCVEVGRSFELDLKGGRGWEDAMRSYT